MRIHDTSLENFVLGQYQNSYNEYQKSVERIASGEYSAADDPAGLAISEKMRAEINGMNQASRNVQDAISLVQTADGAMSQMHTMLQRMNELANQAATGTYDEVQRQAMQEEFHQIVLELQDMARDTNFNGINLLDGSLSEENGGITIQSGAKTGQTMNMTIERLDLEALADLDLTTQEGASAAIDVVRDSIDSLSIQRAKVGAYENRLEFKHENLENMIVNLSEAESRIRDVDIALEMSNLMAQQIKMQVATAMLSQVMSMKQQNVAAVLGMMR